MPESVKKKVKKKTTTTTEMPRGDSHLESSCIADFGLMHWKK